jgi:hypothetical protein
MHIVHPFHISCIISFALFSRVYITLIYYAMIEKALVHVMRAFSEGFIARSEFSL